VREVVLLASRHVRETLRSRRAKLLLALFAASALLALGVPTGSRADATSTLAMTGTLAVLATLVAASAGALLPADRAEGREEWLASLAPGGARRRVAAAVAGVALVLLALPAAGAVAALAAEGSGRSHALRSATAVALPSRTRLPAARDGAKPVPVRIDLASPARAGDVLEVETRALLTSRETAMDVTLAELTRVRVTWAAADRTGEVVVSRRAPMQIYLPRGADAVVLRNTSATINLRLDEARVLGEERSYVSSLVVAALLLALAGAALAPAAVLVSRFTSAPTAVGAALALAVVGMLRGALDDLEPRARPTWQAVASPDPSLEPSALERTAWRVVHAAAHVAPDLSGLAALGEPAAGRTLGLPALERGLPSLLYGAIATALVALPVPRRRSSLRRGA
jgi:hypothetical protein